jgi:hypothetical protein
MGRSRGGLTSKINVVVVTNGLPVRLALTAGEAPIIGCGQTVVALEIRVDAPGSSRL